jgi:hypothetical protein
MKLKKQINSINDSRPNTLQSNEWVPNLTSQTNRHTFLYFCNGLQGLLRGKRGKEKTRC